MPCLYNQKLTDLTRDYLRENYCLMTDDILAIACSILFWVTPIALIIHLAFKKTASNTYKKRLGYIYGGLWAIAWLGYGWLFFNG